MESIGFIRDKTGTKYEVKYSIKNLHEQVHYNFKLFDASELKVGEFEFDVFSDELYALTDYSNVHYRFQKNGIYTAFLIFAKDFFKTLGLKGIRSEGIHRNAESDAFWSKLKGTKIEEVPATYFGDENGTFLNYTFEHAKYTIENIIQSKYDKYLAGLDIYENKYSLKLSKIIIKPEFRESGIGKKIMTDLTKYADANKQVIVLTPSSDFGGNKNRLIQFYKSFSFKHNKGSHINFEFSDSMIRYPKPLTEEIHIMEHLKPFNVFESEYEIFTNTKGGKFWGDQGAGVFVICTSTKRILVAMRSEFVNEPNTWGIIGGAIDEGETPEQGAKRELVEETGYKGIFELIPAYIYEAPNHTFQYHNFIGIIPKEFKANCDWETSHTEWMTLEELLKAEPKHFGLELLLKESMHLIKKHI